MEPTVGFEPAACCLRKLKPAVSSCPLGIGTSPMCSKDTELRPMGRPLDTAWSYGFYPALHYRLHYDALPARLRRWYAFVAFSPGFPWLRHSWQ